VAGELRALSRVLCDGWILKVRFVAQRVLAVFVLDNQVADGVQPDTARGPTQAGEPVLLGVA
jgi:hypothetical protein